MLKYFILILTTCLLLPHLFAQPLTGRRRGMDDFFEFDDHRRDDDFDDNPISTDDSHRIPLRLMQTLFGNNPFVLGRQFGPPPPPPFIPGPPPPPPFIPGPPPPPPFTPVPPPVFVGGPPPPFFPGPPLPLVPLGGLFFPPPSWYPPRQQFYPEMKPVYQDNCENNLPGSQPFKDEDPYYSNKESDYFLTKPLPLEYNTEQNRPYDCPSPDYASTYEYPRHERPHGETNAYQPPNRVNEASPPYEQQKYPAEDFFYERNV